jgi:hypothetical protein
LQPAFLPHRQSTIVPVSIIITGHPKNTDDYRYTRYHWAQRSSKSKHGLCTAALSVVTDATYLHLVHQKCHA